jgi:hypothetical protein
MVKDTGGDEINQVPQRPGLMVSPGIAGKHGRRPLGKTVSIFSS